MFILGGAALVATVMTVAKKLYDDPSAENICVAAETVLPIPKVGSKVIRTINHLNDHIVVRSKDDAEFVPPHVINVLGRMVLQPVLDSEQVQFGSDKWFPTDGQWQPVEDWLFRLWSSDRAAQERFVTFAAALPEYQAELDGTQHRWGPRVSMISRIDSLLVEQYGRESSSYLKLIALTKVGGGDTLALLQQLIG